MQGEMYEGMKGSEKGRCRRRGCVKGHVIRSEQQVKILNRHSYIVVMIMINRRRLPNPRAFYSGLE